MDPVGLIALWEPAVALYGGAYNIINENLQSRRAKALHAATNLVTDFTKYKDWKTRNAIRDGPMLEDLFFVDITEEFASKLARCYVLNEFKGDKLSVAADNGFVNKCGVQTCHNWTRSMQELANNYADAIRVDTFRTEDATPEEVANVDVPKEAICYHRLRDYIKRRGAGEGMSHLLGLDMGTPCAKFWYKQEFRSFDPHIPQWISNFYAKGNALMLDTNDKVSEFVREKLRASITGDLQAVQALIYAKTTPRCCFSVAFGACFAMVLYFLHHSGVDENSVILDNSSVGAWAHHWEDVAWRINDEGYAARPNHGVQVFIEVVRTWTTMAQVSLQLCEEQTVRTRTIVDNASYIGQMAKRLNNMNSTGYLKKRQLWSKTKQENEKLIDNSVFVDFYQNYLKQTEKRDFTVGKLDTLPACGLTPKEIAYAAPKRVSEGKLYTVADSIRVNMLDCLSKREEWSSGSIFSKINAYDAKCFFSGSDYVATDPKSRTVMFYPCDSSWEELRSLHCRSPILSIDSTPQIRVISSIMSASVANNEVSKENFKLLHKGFKKSLDEGIIAGAKIARIELMKLGKLSVVEEKLKTYLPESEVGAVTRELIHDLLGDENPGCISLRTSPDNENYFRKFYKRDLIEGFDEFVIDRKVLIENCEFWKADEEHPYDYVVINGHKAMGVEFLENNNWKLKDVILEFAPFSLPAPKGVRIGDPFVITHQDIHSEENTKDAVSVSSGRTTKPSNENQRDDWNHGKPDKDLSNSENILQTSTRSKLDTLSDSDTKASEESESSKSNSVVYAAKQSENSSELQETEMNLGNPEPSRSKGVSTSASLDENQDSQDMRAWTLTLVAFSVLTSLMTCVIAVFFSLISFFLFLSGILSLTLTMSVGLVSFLFEKHPSKKFVREYVTSTP